MLQEKTNILRRVLESALRMIFHKAKPLDIAEKSQSNPWYGLNLEENAFIESQGYCGATTDLQNLFAHQTILTLFFEDPSAAEEYVLFVSALEGINSLKRIAHGSHIELDNPAYSQRLYQFEMEISIAFIHQTMFIQYDCIKHRFFANFLINMLKKFFAAVLSDSVPLIFHNNRATFHIPLHRQLAVVCTKYLAANNSLDILPDDPNDLKALISHPLRLQAIISEFFAGMWARNGASMATNVILYLQPSFKIFLDNDLALIRLVAAKLHPYELTRLMYKAYHLTDCLKYCCRVEDGSSPLWGAIVTNKEWVPFMLDGYLKLLLEMVFVRSLAEETMEEELRLQTIHVLALLEKPSYSRIRQYFTYIQQIDDALFEKILNEVAEFVKPQVGTSSQHGHFVLRPEYWLGRVDFIQSKHRASSQREFNTIILRMEKELAKNSPNLGERVPWPYYRLPRLERDDLVFTKTSHILMQPANIYVCRFIFEWYVHGDLSIHLLQEAIYTLNLILKLASLSSADNIELEFLDPDDPVESRQSQISTFEQSRLQFFALFNEAPKQPLYPQAKETDSLTLLLIKLFYKLHGEEFPKATGKTQAAQMLQRMCKMNLSGSDQLIGSGVDYLGRLIAWIFNSDPVSQQLIKDEVFTTNQEASSPTTLSLLERKMAARKRQLELIQQQKMKQSALLKRMADIEGLSDDGMETDQTTKSDIVCSICNDHCDDNNIQKPFGLLIYLQTGSVTEDSTPSPSSNTVIGETQMDAYEDPLEGNLVLTFRDFENDAIPCFYKKYPENTIFSLLPYVEIKTCGHHAHLGCYESYRRTVMMSSYSYHRKLPTPCPLCRTNTSYMLPFASRMEQSVFVGFDEIYLDEDRCFSKLLHHLENATLTATLSPHSLKYYEGLQEKVVKLIISRERLRCSAESVNSVSSMLKSLEKNPPLLPLGLIKNYIDRVTLIEQNDYKFSDRLKGILAEHLFYFACVGAKWEFKSLFASIWAKMDGDKGKFEDLFNSTTTASLLHYDSQSLLIICSAALSIFNLNETARLGLFRVFFKFLLSHCFVRTLAVILLNKPAEKRRQILNALVSANSPLSSTYSQLSDYFLQTQLLNSSYPESTTDVITETINNTVSTNVSKFLQFALNLASELQLVMNVTTPKRDDFTALFNHCLNMILGQEMQPLEVIRSVNGSNSRVAHWLNDFLPNASNLQACYTETVWEVKRLCQLPNSFDVLFRAYFDQKCPKCKGISAQPMVCLVCGRLLCIESCCDRKIPEISYPINELEQHSNTCCSGSACFLNVTSTMVVLYHMRSVSLFFSPYLDKHFEEDRNLRRGKSLTISQERFEKLQQLWLTHDFERNPNTTNLFPVDKLSEILKKCHNL
ncbi:E3 ubiquitin-protein ligase [Aphelenchoides bicaudatus]|nr:E3 ubiquitin-protein ligase [Aphelenchoides bicaudatus]